MFDFIVPPFILREFQLVINCHDFTYFFFQSLNHVLAKDKSPRPNALAGPMPFSIGFNNAYESATANKPEKVTVAVFPERKN